jgi:Zn-dependent protease
MLSLLFSDPLLFAIIFGGLILSLSIHEFAHALVADKLGDPTPREQNRLTINPLAHLDPMGTLALAVAGFGWGKPVVFNPYNLKNPLKDAALIAIAGPISNILIAVVLGSLLRFNLISIEWIASAVFQIFLINLGLAIFNLIPVYPLDGSKVLLTFLPRELAIEYNSFMHRYGMFLLLALILPIYQGSSPVSYIITPIMRFIAGVILG